MNKIQIYISCHTNSNLINKDWVDLFAQTLTHLLEAKTKKNIQILSAFDSAETETILQSSMALMIVSSDYYSSATIHHELELLNKLKTTNGANIVRLLFTSDPSALSNSDIQTIDLNFLLTDPFTHINLLREDGYFSEKAFWLKLIDLSHLLTPRELQNTHFDYKIFMTTPSPDIIQQWESVKRELTFMGHQVLTLSDDETFSGLNKHTTAALENSDLIVHMVGGQIGSTIDGKDVVMEQISIAASYCEKNKIDNRLIWLPDTLVIRDEKQRLSIEKMKRGNKMLSGAEMIQTPLESFKAILQQKIHKSEEPVEQKPGENRALLLYTPQMAEHGKKMAEILSKTKIEIIHPLLIGEKSELLKHHWQALLTCDWVVLFFDENQKDWVNSKRKDIIKASGFGRTMPITKKILVKQETDHVDQMELDDFEMVNLSDMTAIEAIFND